MRCGTPVFPVASLLCIHFIFLIIFLIHILYFKYLHSFLRQIVPRRVSGIHGRLEYEPEDETTIIASKLFDQYCTANTFAGITSTFQQICDVLELKPSDHQNFYYTLKSRLTSWKAQNLWAKLDKRAQQREYKKGKACSNTRVSTPTRLAFLTY